jgi:hypothetical protein
MPGRRCPIIFSPVPAMMKRTQPQSSTTVMLLSTLSDISRSTTYSASSTREWLRWRRFIMDCSLMGALVRPQLFPMVTRGDRRAITPAKTFETFSIVFPNEPLTLKLDALKADQEWNDWNDTRNVLSHRMIPGRQYLLSTAESGPGGALWRIENGIEIAIDSRTTASRREWLSRQLSQILDSAHTFAEVHF